MLRWPAPLPPPLPLATPPLPLPPPLPDPTAPFLTSGFPPLTAEGNWEGRANAALAPRRWPRCALAGRGLAAWWSRPSRGPLCTRSLHELECKGMQLSACG